MGKHFLGNFEIYCIPSKSQSTMSGLTKRCMCVCERERSGRSRARITAKSENAFGGITRCLFSFKIEGLTRGQMAIIRSVNSCVSYKQVAACV